MTNYLITGVVGFIGSNLAKRLLDMGHTVIGIDRKPFSPFSHQVFAFLENPNFHYFNYDLKDGWLLLKLRDYHIDFVFHLAANADIRFSAENPEKDLEAIQITYTLLRYMKTCKITNIAYASSAAMYGDATIIPTPEYYHPTQTSFYGASKAACEGWIEADCAAFGTQAWIFRFSSIIGEGYSHGFIYNFYRYLKNDPRNLFVAGGLEQRKSYLYIQDCIDGMLDAINLSKDKINTFNLGHTDTISLPEAIPVITKHMGLKPKIMWSGNEVGWIGDSKICHLSTSKLQALGWKPKVSIKEGIVKTLEWLDANPWILKRGEV